MGNDAATTAHNIADAAYIVVTLLLYELLKLVNKRLSSLAEKHR